MHSSMLKTWYHMYGLQDRTRMVSRERFPIRSHRPLFSIVVILPRQFTEQTIRPKSEKKFADYQTILQTGQEMKDAGYRDLCISLVNLDIFAGSEPWIVDGKLNVSQARKGFHGC